MTITVFGQFSNRSRQIKMFISFRQNCHPVSNEREKKRSQYGNYLACNFKSNEGYVPFSHVRPEKKTSCL